MTRVALWRISLEMSDTDALMLSEDERARAARFRFTPDRNAWIAARAGLRRALAQTLNCAPGAVQFARAAHGKPRLASDADHARVRFSLSHTSGLALVAVTEDGKEVGVDVEQTRTDFDPLTLAPSVLAPDELACLQETSASAHPALFFTLWTAKEAVLKAEGCGLSASPAAFSVLPVWQGHAAGAHGFQVRSLRAGEGYAAALAVPDQDVAEPEIIWHELCMFQDNPVCAAFIYDDQHHCSCL